MVWDTAGQEEFDAITRAYYRGQTHLLLQQSLSLPSSSPPGAQVCVIAFSTVDRESFLAIERWKQKVQFLLASPYISLCLWAG